MSEEETTAKRKEIAAGIRAEAAKLDGTPKMMLLLESLVYEKDIPTIKQTDALGTAFQAEIEKVPADKIESKKGEVMQMSNALKYLAKEEVLPANSPGILFTAKLIKEHGWDGKK